MIKNKTRILSGIAALFIIILLMSCSDDITKQDAENKFPRIEYSNCTACYDCIEKFNCPRDAIRIDERTHTVYIDQNRCIKCYDCLNAFSCEYDAITRSPDLTAPAQPQEIMAVSDSIGVIDIYFTSPGDDSLQGMAYLYELQIFDNEGEEIETGFEPPLPRMSGSEEHWQIDGLPEYETLSVQITAYDEVGLASGLAQAEVEVMGEYIDTEAPGAITDLTAISSEYTIELQWTAPEDPEPRANVEAYIIKKHSSEITGGNWAEAVEIEHELIPQSAGSQESLLLEYTEPSGYLYFGICSVDAAGNTSEISNNTTGEATTDITAPGTIDDLIAGDPGNTSVPLFWTAPGDNGHTGRAQGYKIRYAETAIDETNWEAAQLWIQEIEPQVAGSAESISITGLAPETEYYFAIKAYDEVENISGLSNNASTITEATPDTEAPGRIEDLSAAAGDTEIELTWTAPGDDGYTGNADSYLLYYADVQITPDNLETAEMITNLPYPSPANTAESYVMESLTAGINWYFALIAKDEAGNESELSNNAEAEIYLDLTPPAAVSDLSAEVNDTEVLLSWTAPGDDGLEGTAAAYSIRKYNEPLAETNWESATEIEAPAPEPSGTVQSVILADLDYNITWYFALKATDEEGNTGEMSNNCDAIIEIEIDEIAPAAITDIEVATGQSSYINRISISWTAPGDDDNTGQCTAYEIRYNSSPVTETNWESSQVFASPPSPQTAGSSQSCQITGLSAGNVYYFAVRGIDEAGNMGGISNSPGGKLVYQINAGQCHDCNSCIWRCDQNAIYDAGSYKAINPELCIGCGECLVCPWDAIHAWVIGY